MNLQNNNGLTVLHVAASSNNKEFVQCLAEACADLSISDNIVIRPLDLARFNGHDEIAEMIGEKLVRLITASLSTRVRIPFIDVAREDCNEEKLASNFI